MVLGSIWNGFKSGVQEMLIQRPDDKKDLIVYKHPENTIPNMAQLTVDADEAAVFFRDGSLIGVLRTAGAGQRHQLTTENIPFLGQLIIDRVTGENIFTTDLFFVTMRPIYNQRFGGPLGMMEDPLLGEMVTPRIFGSFAFQIVDPARFIVGYHGLRGEQSNEQVVTWIKQKFMNSIKTVMGQVCVSQGKSLLELMAMTNELARAFETNCPDLAEIGIRIGQVGDFEINLTEEDRETLKTAQGQIGQAKRDARIAQIGIAQAQAEAQQRQFELDQDFSQDSRYTGLAGGDFTRAAAGKAMIGAGQGMAQGGGGGGEGGGGAGPMLGGAGLGVGFGMAQAFGQAMHAPRQPMQAGPSGQVACPGCNAQVPPGKFCAECGTQLATGPKFCPSCGQENGPGAKFCSGCGTSVGG